VRRLRPSPSSRNQGISTPLAPSTEMTSKHS
jgi:hypothetical protein